jgi:hypothetical protein
MPSGPTRDRAPSSSVTGYLHPSYARSHEAFGTPRELPRCRGWIIERAIPGTDESDAMGCYPLFSCQDWPRLHLDIADLGDELVSLTMVTDPFGDYDEAYLRQCFPDLAIPFKEHFVVDLEKPRNEVISDHHRYEVRKAKRKNVSVRTHPYSPEFLDEWMTLHGHLIEKHDIKGINAFSRDAFAVQLSTPGLEILRATIDDEPVAAMLNFVQGNVVHAHILGCSNRGYANGALYAIIGYAIEHFTGSARWLNLMGVPGGEDSAASGIHQFKRGWTKETRTAWLCGVVLNRRRYTELVEATDTREARYFPAYRAGEMA